MLLDILLHHFCDVLFVFLFFSLSQIIGLILLVVGIWAETERRQYRYLNNQLSAPVALLIFVGLFIAVNSLFGVLGTLKENVTLLKLVGIKISTVFYAFFDKGSSDVYIFYYLIVFLCCPQKYASYMTTATIIVRGNWKVPGRNPHISLV